MSQNVKIDIKSQNLVDFSDVSIINLKLDITGKNTAGEDVKLSLKLTGKEQDEHEESED